MGPERKIHALSTRKKRNSIKKMLPHPGNLPPRHLILDLTELKVYGEGE